MTTIAAIRPDDWNLPLLLHVAGAMVLVGALAVVTASLVSARGGDAAALTRLSFRTLLYAALPGFILTRVSAEWIASEEDVDDEATWIGIGYMVSDFGLLLLIVGTVLIGVAMRRLRRDEGPPGRAAGVATALISLTLAGYLVAIWAMTTKPD
jgi:hypothetical protein